MKPRTLFFALVLPLVPPCLFAQSAPLDRAEILGRLAQANPPSYIAHLIKTRGISFTSREDFLFRVKLAGGDGILVARLSSIDSPASTSFTDEDRRFDHLANCAELIHTGDIESAEPECHASIEENPKSPWPLLVTAELIQRNSFARTSSESDEAEKAERMWLLRRAASLGANVAAVHQAIAQALASTDAKLDSIPELQAASSLDPERLELGEIGGWGARLGSAFDFREDVSQPPPSSSEPITIAPELLRHIQLDSDLASNHVGLAYQYFFQAHNFEQAQYELQEAIRLEPDNAQLHLNLGLFYFYRRNADASVAELREAVRIVPFGSLQRLALAGALETLARTPEAVTELQNLLAICPTAIEASNALVEIYLKHKDRKSAIAELRRSLKASSLTFSDQAKFANARFQDLDSLANLLKENRELDAAAEQYLFLLRHKPDSAPLHNDYGNVLLDQHRLDEAMGEYNEALRLEPEMSTAHHNIGICLALRKNLEGAITEFRQALELNPDEPHTQEFLGAALAQKGDLSGAMDQFQQAIEKRPEDAEPHVNLAHALELLKDTPRAIEELKLALKLQPDFPTAENNLAWIYATTDDHKFRNPAEALVLARRAVQSSPAPNPAFLDTLAEALLINGQPAEALTTETQAAKLDPDNSEIQSRLTRFREAAHSQSSPMP